MKVSLAARDLKRALNTCNEVAPISSAIAEEKTGVLIKASGKSVVFMSSDGNMSFRVEVPAVKITEEGEALVKCSSIASSVAATFEEVEAEAQIGLETTGKSTLLVSGVNRFGKHTRRFPLLNPGFFIETPTFDSNKATQFPAFSFMDGINAVSHAASKDVSKLNFNCIEMKLLEHEVVFAATDGRQIAEFRKAAEVKGLRGSFIMSLKFAALAAKFTNPELDVVHLYVENDKDGRLLFLKSGGTVLVGSLLNATFPDYTAFLSTEGLKQAVFPKEPFLAIIQGMQPTVDVKSHRLVIDAKSSGLASLSTSSITGDAESSDLSVNTPEDFTLHFDSHLLQGTVRQTKGEQFEFYFAGDTKAKGVIIKSTKDESFRAFVCSLKQID